MDAQLAAHKAGRRVCVLRGICMQQRWLTCLCVWLVQLVVFGGICKRPAGCVQSGMARCVAFPQFLVSCLPNKPNTQHTDTPNQVKQSSTVRHNTNSLSSPARVNRQLSSASAPAPVPATSAAGRPAAAAVPVRIPATWLGLLPARAPAGAAARHIPVLPAPPVPVTTPVTPVAATTTVFATRPGVLLHTDVRPAAAAAAHKTQRDPKHQHLMSLTAAKA